jgi:hypothetical protein
MAIDTTTVRLLTSVLSTPLARDLFSSIANKRLAPKNSFQETDQSNIQALKEADLIGVASSGENYYVTAKGMKVAEDLATLNIG